MKLNNISNFYITVDGCNSFISNGVSSSIIYSEPIRVSPQATQAIMPQNLHFCTFTNTTILDSLTVSIVGDNGVPIDMTSGWYDGVYEPWNVILILQDIKE